MSMQTNLPTNALAAPEAVLASAYAEKDDRYYQCVRLEMLPFIPAEADRILDVGCGAGAFGATLLRQKKREIWGVEPKADAAAKAREMLDHVHDGFFDESLNLPSDYFDCIVFNDVLEHMLDPQAALSLAKTLLRRNGVIVASIPNIGHFATVWRLAIRGEWEYKESGILDKTHLRFFTRSSIEALFESLGYSVATQGINPFVPLQKGDRRLWQMYRVISLLVPTRAVRDMRFLQFAVTARVSKHAV